MKDCIFCKIINKEIPSDIVYEDEKVVAFRDLEPQAPVHLLIVPKTHIASLNDVEPKDLETMGWLLTKVKEIAASQNLANGYRLVCNTGEDALQTVKHIHFHLLGRRLMQWPPG
ncbi:MAG TPA: histidine triad nucleotide-binding protein [Clostridiales bacterium]|jgi:histidine triad (HIT) family protein|nr:histidine triad nucleotide-binding protein [Clostridiales bacterium]